MLNKTNLIAVILLICIALSYYYYYYYYAAFNAPYVGHKMMNRKITEKVTYANTLNSVNKLRVALLA